MVVLTFKEVQTKFKKTMNRATNTSEDTRQQEQKAEAEKATRTTEATKIGETTVTTKADERSKGAEIVQVEEAKATGTVKAAKASEAEEKKSVTEGSAVNSMLIELVEKVKLMVNKNPKIAVLIMTGFVLYLLLGSVERFTRTLEVEIDTRKSKES